VSPDSDRALPVARQLAAQLGAQAQPVMVVEPGERAAGAARTPTVGDVLLLESLSAASMLVDVGRRPYRLLCMAVDADPASNALARAVARAAETPVVFVGPDAPSGPCPPLRRLVVLPGSRLTVAMARWIDRLASRIDATVVAAPSAPRAWRTRDRSAALVGRADAVHETIESFEWLESCSVPWIALPARSDADKRYF
jgi:hypothetical protein